MYVYIFMYVYVSMTVSIEIATTPIYTKSRNSVFSVSRGTNSIWDFGLIWNCTQEFEFLDLVDFGGVPLSLETVKCSYIYAFMFECMSLFMYMSSCMYVYMPSCMHVYSYNSLPVKHNRKYLQRKRRTDTNKRQIRCVCVRVRVNVRALARTRMYTSMNVWGNETRYTDCVAVCCSVLQCIAVCCSVLHCVVVGCSVLQCFAMCCSVCSWKCTHACMYGVIKRNIQTLLQCVGACCSGLRCVAMCCGVLQCVAVGSSVLQCVAAVQYCMLFSHT